ncbi:MAG: stage III sporulation protein AF [Oscillospiraceae bacterium]|nr:stage III sporulation protein AF [Oscillospiraceae bacterium]
MAEFLRNWIITVTAAATLAAIATALIPEGNVKKASSLVLGLVLMLAVISPVKRLTGEDVGRLTEEFMVEMEESAAFNFAGEEMMTEIIEQELRTYILDKADSLGADIRVQGFEFQTLEGGVSVPVKVYLSGQLTPALSAVIEQDLGIGKDSQICS